MARKNIPLSFQRRLPIKFAKSTFCLCRKVAENLKRCITSQKSGKLRDMKRMMAGHQEWILLKKQPIDAMLNNRNQG